MLGIDTRASITVRLKSEFKSVGAIGSHQNGKQLLGRVGPAVVPRGSLGRYAHRRSGLGRYPAFVVVW